MLHQVNDTAGVTPFVIVPGNNLDESWVKHDTGTGIKDGRDGVSFVVSGNKGLVGVSEESLHVTVSTSLDLLTDLLVGGLLGEFACKIDDRNINGGDTESHTGKFSLKSRNNLGNGLGSSGGRGNDVTRGGTSSTPVLAGTGVDNGLGGGHGVDGSHEGLLNSESIVDGLDHGGKTVGGTGSTRDEVLRSIVFVLVDPHDNSLGVILGGGRVDDLLGSSINDGLGLLLGEENSGGFADVFCSLFSPADFLGVTAAGGLDLLSC